MATVDAGANDVGTLPRTVRRDFSGVDHDEAMCRARALVPTLRERAQGSEDARVLLRDKEQLLPGSGLFRFHRPRIFGGMELPFVAVVDIVVELGRGCPSTAWNVGHLGAHRWILAFSDPESQHASASSTASSVMGRTLRHHVE
jgi:3-hydroxy-9,10-secoandrosta-1,3,5(10)-triene-9,17-dione monooxygenase